MIVNIGGDDSNNTNMCVTGKRFRSFGYIQDPDVEGFVGCPLNNSIGETETKVLLEVRVVLGCKETIDEDVTGIKP